MADQNPVLKKWNRLKGSAFGRWLASRLVGWAAPYSGTIGATIEVLEPGRVVIAMRDRRKVRNHLRSIHAAAMLNLCEMTGGLLSLASIQADARMIIRRVNVDFEKKARGRLLAEGRCATPETSERAELEVSVVIRDQEGDTVAAGTVTTLIGPAE